MPMIEGQDAIYVLEYTWPDGGHETVKACEDLNDVWQAIRHHLESDVNLLRMEWRKHPAYLITIVPIERLPNAAD